MTALNNITYKKHSGVGLIELMISIVIGVLILSGVIQLYSTSRGNAALSSGQSIIQDNLRFLMTQLEIDAGQSGSLGCFSHAFRKNQNFIGDILTKDNKNEAKSGSILRRYNIGQLIDGSNNSGLLDTDTILFRYASTFSGIPVDTYFREGNSSNQITLDLSTTAAKQRFVEIEQYDILLAADCSGAIYFMVTNNPSDTPGDTEVLEFKSGITAPSDHINKGQQNRLVTGFTITKLEDENDVNDNEDSIIVGNWSSGGGLASTTRPYVYSTAGSRAVVYKIGDSLMAQDLSKSCTADTPEYCALLRDDVEIADGVENFQIEYGWHVNGDEAGTLRFGDASQVPADQWNHIDRIRVSLTLNSITPVSTQNGSQLIRRSYVRTIALRNQMGD